MAIVNEKFNIPEDMMKRLFSGELKRYGGVLRYAEGPKKGEIFKMLDPVSDNQTESKSKSSSEQSIGICIGVISMVFAAGAGYVIWRVKKTKEIRAFEKALKKYIDSLKTGTPSILLINELKNSIQELKKREDYEEYIVSLSAGELVVLVDQVVNYTRKMAENNFVKISSATKSPTNDFMSRLEHSLDEQIRIIQLAA